MALPEIDIEKEVDKDMLNQIKMKLLLTCTMQPLKFITIKKMRRQLRR